jgi:hypothetical protein
MQRLLTGSRSPQRGSNQERHANLFEAAGRKTSMQELEECIKSGFQKAFSCTLVVDDLTGAERALLSDLKRKYALLAQPTVTA